MNAAEEIKSFIALLPDEVPHNPERAHIATASAKLSQKAFQALVGFFTGLALIAACGRIVYYCSRRGKLFFDDILIIFASCCLITATGILYYLTPRLFMMEVLSANTANFVLYSKAEIMSLFGMLKWLNLFLGFVWTANYAVKLSFLVFFKNLIRDVSRNLLITWWFVLAFTILSWLFNLFQNPVNCGWNTEVKCFPYPKHISELGWVCTVVDSVTDIAIILIPILLLRKSFLRLNLKLRILAFTCLNIFCVAIAIARVAGGAFHNDGRLVFRIVYTYVLIHTEACIAVIMGGVTAFRTVFATYFQEREHRRPPSFYNRVRSWFRKPGSGSEVDLEGEECKSSGEFLRGPATGGTIRGLRTFIRRNGREGGHTTHDSTMKDSRYDPLESYHNYIRGETQRPGSKSLNSVKTSEVLKSNETIERPMPVLQSHNMI